jgi:hypothetical protein
MKYTKVFISSVVICLFLIGCTKEDLEFWGAIPPIGPQPNPKISIALNPTEARLFGKWYLRSMSTKDSTYNDSAWNRNFYIDFTNMAHSSKTMPIINDVAMLALKGTPPEHNIMGTENYYGAADSGKLRIAFKVPNYYAVDTVVFSITTLNDSNLVLADSAEKKQWVFYR